VHIIARKIPVFRHMTQNRLVSRYIKFGGPQGDRQDKQLEKNCCGSNGFIQEARTIGRICRKIKK